MMKSFRMSNWVVSTLLLLMVALISQSVWPASVIPYDRPHQYLGNQSDSLSAEASVTDIGSTPSAFSQAMLRRAIIVAACLICVGLGA